MKTIQFLLVFLLLFFWTISTAQVVQVNLVMPPPYSIHLEDYLEFRAKSVVTLTNLSDNTVSLKLLGSTTSLDGSIAVNVGPGYQPASPIILAPRASRVLNGAQLRAINGNLNPDHITYQGLDVDYLLRSGTLPEGQYQFCLRAFDYETSAPLSLPMSGCTIVQLSNYDPPIIVQPVDGSNVNTQGPQLLNFIWTPAGLPGTTRYTLRLVDMTDTGLFNPNDAFTGLVLPFFERSNLLSNTYNYTLSDLPLQKGHQYAVQVEAYDPTQSIAFKNGGRSAVTTFRWQPLDLINAPDETESQGNIFNPGLGFANNNPGSLPDPPNGDCTGATLYEGPLGGSPRSTIINGTDVSVGHFVLKNTIFTKSAGGSFNGTGLIKVNFLNLTAEVAFQGIQVNTDNRMTAGKITGKVTANTIINDNMSQTKDGVIDNIPDEQGLLDLLQNAGNLVSNLNPDAPHDLPVSFANDDYHLGIVGLIFEPTQAYVNAVLPVAVPQSINGDWLTVGSKGIPVQPNGWGAPEIKVALSNEASIGLSNKLSLAIREGVDHTYALLDCDGFHSLRITGAFELSREAALPLDDDFKVINDETVKVNVPFVVDATTNLEDFLLFGAGFSHPFSIPQARDFVIEGGAVSIDFASSANSEIFDDAFPGKGNDWIGLYLESLDLTLPKGFKKEGGGRISIALSDLMVDKKGINLLASAEGEPLAEGSLASWGMQLDAVNLQISESQLSGGGLAGWVQLPLGEQANVGFTATVTEGNAQGANYLFGLETGDAVEADLFLAQIALYEGSKVNISRKNGQFSAEAILNGEISIGFAQKKENSNVGKLNIPSLKFQELSISGKEDASYIPELDLAFASLNTQGNIQAKISDAFELGLDKLEFKKKKEGNVNLVGLNLGFGLSLFGGGEDDNTGFGASTSFTVWANYDAQARTFKYNKAQLNALSLGGDLGVAYLSGSIEIYDQDQEFGNGFRGGIIAEVKGVDVGIEVNMQFGRTLGDDGFKYWYFDAMVDLPAPGLNIPTTPLSFYGFGGGAWCNMANGSPQSTPLKPGQYVAEAGGKPGAPTVSGAKFTPQYGKAGFKASVLLGMTGSQDAFNGDITFNVYFDHADLSLDSLVLDGNGYVMQDVAKVPRSQDDAMVTCNVHLTIDILNRAFGGSFTVAIDASSAAQGAGTASMFFQLPKKTAKGEIIPDNNLKWHIKIGQWTENIDDPFKDKARINGMIGFANAVAEYNLQFQAYFMAGNDLPAGLPPLPQKIYNAVKNKGAIPQAALPAQVSDTQNLAFALGAGLKFNAGFDFKIVHADMSAEAALDVLISNLNATCDGEEIGFNGWYAQGQIYAYVQGAAGVFGIDVVEVAAGAVLQGKLPNPTWVNGMVVMYIDIGGKEVGDYEGHFERGTLCNVQTELEPFTGSELIKAVKPTHLTKGVDPINPEIWVEFAYEKGEEIAIYNSYTEKYQYYKFDAQVSLKTKAGEYVELEDFNWYGNKMVLTPLGILPGHSEYHLHIDATVKKGDQLEAEEHAVVKFGTGAAPTEFNASHLTASYPLPRQRYFMKESFDGGAATGMLGLNKDLCYLINPDGKESFVQMIEENTGQSRIAACSCIAKEGFNSKVFFTIPQGLKNETIYHLKIVNRAVNIASEPGENPEPVADKYIFEGLYFRTSKYNNMVDKLNDFELAKIAYVPYSASYSFNYFGNSSNSRKYYVPVMLFEYGEPLERYDTEFYNIGNGVDQSYRGKMLREYKPSEQWMSLWHTRYRDFLMLPSENDRQFLSALAQGIGVHRQNGFPFEGEGAEPMDFQITDMYYMQNHAYYDMILRANNQITSGESLRKSAQPLSKGEIQAAFANLPEEQGGIGNAGNITLGNSGGGGMVNNQLGLNFNSNVQSYFPIMDFTPMVANHDKKNFDIKILNKALGNSGYQFTKAFNLLKGLGWIDYKGTRQLELKAWEPRKNKPQAWRSFPKSYLITK